MILALYKKNSLIHQNNQANPLNPVATANISLGMMFFSSLSTKSIRLQRVAFAKMWAISWKLSLNIELWVLHEPNMHMFFKK